MPTPKLPKFRNSQVYFACPFFLSPIIIVSLLHCTLAAAATRSSELEATQKRITELETQLGEKNSQLGRAEQDHQRVAAAETELQAKLQRAVDDLAAARRTHEHEIQRLSDARIEVEGQLMKERDAAVKRAEDMDAQQIIEIQRAQA